MNPRIFITGATGLIGGDYLHILTEKYPSWNVVVLIRSAEKVDIVTKAFPNVIIIRGSLDDSDILERESKEADVVLNFADCDHELGAQAIVKGLSQRNNVGTLIHTSGAKIIAWETESQPNKWGLYHPRQYNDWDGVRELTSLPSDEDPQPTGFGHVLPNWSAHRNVDRVVLEGFHKHPSTVRTAIVCPPTVYGPSRFPGFTRSIQIPRLLNTILQRRRTFLLNENRNRWNRIHTQDISELYLLLTEAAVDQRPGDLWNENGYYFAENGDFEWKDVLETAGRIGFEMGLLDRATPVQLTGEAISEEWVLKQMNVFSTSVGRSQRAKKILGWKPQREEFLEDLNRAIAEEVVYLAS